MANRFAVGAAGGARSVGSTIWFFAEGAAARDSDIEPVRVSLQHDGACDARCHAAQFDGERGVHVIDADPQARAFLARTMRVFRATYVRA